MAPSEEKSVSLYLASVQSGDWIWKLWRGEMFPHLLTIHITLIWTAFTQNCTSSLGRCFQYISLNQCKRLCWPLKYIFKSDQWSLNRLGTDFKTTLKANKCVHTGFLSCSKNWCEIQFKLSCCKQTTVVLYASPKCALQVLWELSF